MLNKNEMNIYVKKVKKSLPVFCPDQKKFLIGLRQELQDYVTLQSDYNLDSLCAAFGTPQNMAAQFIDTLTPAEVHASQKKRKIVVLCFIIILISFITILSIFLHKQMQVQLDCDTVILTESQPYQLTDEEIEAMIRQEENKNESKN